MTPATETVASTPRPSRPPLATWWTPWVLFGLALGIRLFFLFISDNDDGDAFARVLLSRRIVDDHVLIPTPDWLPAHYWLLAIPYAFGLQAQIWPRLLTAIAGAAGIPAAYLMTRPWIGARAALVTALLLVFNPLHIRLSVVTVSEPFFLLFVTAGLWGFFRYIEGGLVRHLAAGAMAFDLACGHRMEGWVLVACLPLIAALHPMVRERAMWRVVAQRVVTFVIPASAFAVWWMTLNYVRYGDALYNVHLTLQKNLSFTPYQTSSTWYVLAFWPIVMLASLGPLAFIAASAGFVRSVRERASRWIAFLLVAFLAIYYVQCARSGLNTDARYGLILVWLAILNAGAAYLPTSSSQTGGVNRHWARYWAPAACTWVCVIWLLAELPLGTLSAKMASLSPRPLFSAGVHDIDRWLESQPDRDSVVLGPDLGRYGPWLSTFDDWNRGTSVEVMASPETLSTVMAGRESGYIIARRDGPLARDLAGFPDSAARVSAVKETQYYVVYRWLPRTAPESARRASPSDSTL